MREHQPDEERPVTLWQRLADHVLGRGGGTALPARIQAAVDHQQDSSEILIASVQLVLVLVFAALYAAAPKTFSPDATFAPVPFALAAYLGFSLLRLGLALRGRLPRWFLALSVIADVTLLMGLIWSFHLQYEQPAAFYLKAPTLLYVFIFIALRALRYDLSFLLLAGLSASVGWLILLAYAVAYDMEASPVTRDYIAYMTSNRILLGAEIDKVISIALTTAILAVAIVRARRLLVRAIADEAATRDLSRFFAPEIALAIRARSDGIEPGRGELRDAAILHCDIRGFTRLVHRLPPDSVMALLADYQARMIAVITRYGGSIDKFLGDGILASFGATRPSATFVADALRAAVAVVAAADIWAAARRAAGQEPIDIAVTVATGPVVFGAVGDASRLEYTVIGDAVNVAAKLDRHCKVEGCRALVTGEALALAAAQGYEAPSIEPLHGRMVEGIGRPLDLVVLAR